MARKVLSKLVSIPFVFVVLLQLFNFNNTVLAQGGCGVLGDINCDGIVNIQDFILLSNAFGTDDTAADLNSDGIANIQDFIILSNNFGRIGPTITPFPTLSPTSTSVSSPTSTASPVGAYFTVEVADESFCLYSTNQNTIKLAKENFKGLNNYILSGPTRGGSGGFNYGYGGLPDDKYWRHWSWHMDPEKTIMVGGAIELCDGLPSAVEYGMLDGRGYCPWLSKIVATGCRTPKP